MGGAMEMFKKFAADRIARKVGKLLINGNGVNTILGLVPSLAALGVTPVTAVGSAGNSGGAEDGSNSIGSKDVATLYYSVNEAYRNSPKAAWFMNDGTRAYLAQIVSKQGVPLVQWQGPEAYIFGKPVKVCPGMDSIGASKSPVVFGDGAIRFDQPVLRWFVEHREPWLTTAMRIVTVLGGSAFLIPLVLAVGSWYWQRYRTPRPLNCMCPHPGM